MLHAATTPHPLLRLRGPEGPHYLNASSAARLFEKSQEDAANFQVCDRYRERGIARLAILRGRRNKKRPMAR